MEAQLFDQIMTVLQVLVIPAMGYIAKLLRDTSKNVKDVEKSVAVLMSQQEDCAINHGRLNEATKDHAVVIGKHEVEITNLKHRHNH